MQNLSVQGSLAKPRVTRGNDCKGLPRHFLTTKPIAASNVRELKMNWTVQPF